MKLTRLVPAITAAAAVALLAGCSPMPSKVAVVNGSEITASQLQTATSGCAFTMGVADDQIRQAGVVQTLVLGKVMEDLAEAGGLTQDLLDQQVDQQLAQLTPLEGSASEVQQAQDDCRPLLRESVKVSALLQGLDQATALAVFEASDVEVNPRFGRWDPASASLFTESGSISISSAATLQ